MARLSAELQRFFFDQDCQPQVTLADIFKLSGERTFGFLFVLLSIPSALPVPAPGYSIPFGIVMFILAVQLIIGRNQPWLPAAWYKHNYSSETIRGILKKGIPWLRRIELISRPRLTYVCTSLPGRMIIGGAIALMSMSMMLPIPLTNTLPAIGIFVTGFGLLDDDGAISLGGLVICLMGLILTSTILIGIVFGIDFINNWVQNS